MKRAAGFITLTRRHGNGVTEMHVDAIGAVTDYPATEQKPRTTWVTMRADNGDNAYEYAETREQIMEMIAEAQQPTPADDFKRLLVDILRELRETNQVR